LVFGAGCRAKPPVGSLNSDFERPMITIYINRQTSNILMEEEHVRVALAIGLLLLLLGATSTGTLLAASAVMPSSSALYKVQIYYYLVNLNFDDRVVHFTIPIPPNTTWQSTHLVFYSRQPTHPLYHDIANNSLMDFSILVPSLNVTRLEYDVAVQVNSTPGYPVNPAISADRGAIPASMQNFTVPTYWWNYTDPVFASAEGDLLVYSSETDLFKIANGVRNETLRALPTFRANPLRLGATEALTLSLGGAGEYSDVFVALMRSLSLPSTRLWSWLVSDVQQGVVTWNAFVQSAIWSPNSGWLPYDVTTSRYVNRPAIGEVSDRIITFYIENNLPGPGTPIALMLGQDQSFFPGGGAGVKSGVLATTRVFINYIPSSVSAAVQFFTLTTTVGVYGAATLLIIVVVAVGYLRARTRRRAYQERLDEFEKRLRGATRG
jgi:transglutaminase superfamily protein